MILALATIGDALIRLAVARGALLDDVASEVYTEGLRDLAPGLVSRACKELGQEPREEFGPAMPPLAVIRTRVHELARFDDEAEALKRLLPHDESKERRYCCVVCQDDPNGWRSVWCHGVGPARLDDMPRHVVASTILNCGRRQDHAPHTYADRCACVETNPVIHRARERARANVQKRATRKAS